MKTVTKTFMEIYNEMSFVSKYAFKYGTVLIITLFVMAIYFYVKSKTVSDPYFDSMMFTDIMICIKECMGSIYVLPMLYETIFMSLKR